MGYSVSKYFCSSSGVTFIEHYFFKFFSFQILLTRYKWGREAGTSFIAWP